MGSLLKGFGSLNTVWKLIIGFVLIFILFWATDKFHGGWSSVKKNWRDKATAERTEKVAALEKENEELRKTRAADLQHFVEMEKRALEAETKNTVFENRIAELGGQAVTEQLKLEKALQEIDREEAITNQPVDNFTRCNRARTKLIERGIKSAAEINCNQYTGTRPSS